MQMRAGTAVELVAVGTCTGHLVSLALTARIGIDVTFIDERSDI